jgi:hypothetical protein
MEAIPGNDHWHTVDAFTQLGLAGLRTILVIIVVSQNTAWCCPFGCGAGSGGAVERVRT